MTLTSGTRLGPYEIVAPLVAGDRARFRLLREVRIESGLPDETDVR